MSLNYDRHNRGQRQRKYWKGYMPGYYPNEDIIEPPLPPEVILANTAAKYWSRDGQPTLDESMSMFRKLFHDIEMPMAEFYGCEVEDLQQQLTDHPTFRLLVYPFLDYQGKVDFLKRVTKLSYVRQKALNLSIPSEQGIYGKLVRKPGEIIEQQTGDEIGRFGLFSRTFDNKLIPTLELPVSLAFSKRAHIAEEGQIFWAATITDIYARHNIKYQTAGELFDRMSPVSTFEAALVLHTIRSIGGTAVQANQPQSLLVNEAIGNLNESTVHSVTGLNFTRNIDYMHDVHTQRWFPRNIDFTRNIDVQSWPAGMSHGYFSVAAFALSHA